MNLVEQVFDDKIHISQAAFAVETLAREDYGYSQEKELKALKFYLEGKIKSNDIIFALEILNRPDYGYEAEKNLKVLSSYFNGIISQIEVNKQICFMISRLG